MYKKELERDIMRRLNIEKIQRRIARTISTEEALKDVIPFQNEDVLAERSKIILTVDPGLKKREDRL